MYATARQLGATQYVPRTQGATIAEVVINGALSLYRSIFGTSSFPEKKARIDSWVRAISCDPNLTQPLTRWRWARLRCGSGDNALYADLERIGMSQGTQQFCGFETAHGSRQYAAAAVQGLLQHYPMLATTPNADPALLEPQSEGAPEYVVGCDAIEVGNDVVLPNDGAYIPPPGGGIGVGVSATFSPLALVGVGLLGFAIYRSRQSGGR